jgi:hypothetical protein
MAFDKALPNPLLNKESEQIGFILKTLSMEKAIRFAYKNTPK